MLYWFHHVSAWPVSVVSRRARIGPQSPAAGEPTIQKWEVGGQGLCRAGRERRTVWAMTSTVVAVPAIPALTCGLEHPPCLRPCPQLTSEANGVRLWGRRRKISGIHHFSDSHHCDT